MMYEKMMTVFLQAVKEYGSIGKLAQMVELPKSSMARWVAGASIPSIDSMGKILDYLGYKLVKKDDPFDDTRKHNNFVSVPIIRNPSLIRPGYIPQDNISGWCAVEKDFPSVCNRSDLIVLHVKDTAMSPSIPEDSLILIDRGDTVIQNGSIYLVRTPQGCTILRRVAVTGRRISFSHGNPKSFVECNNYDIERDYEGDLSLAIVGRAIWMRCKITDK